MRGISSTAAKALNSIALRYQHGLSLRGGTARPVTVANLRAVAYEEAASPPTHDINTPLARDDRAAAVEAVLFVTPEPLNLRKIAQFARLADATEARTLIRRLNQLYDLGGSAFRIEEVAGGYRLLTRRKFGGWLRRLHQSSAEVRLSSPALETLAVVAYRQPVLRAAIETIRGVQCGEILRQLMERDLVRIVGRSEELGRPFLYATTKRFLQVFGLRDLDELPRAEYLRTVPMTPANNELSALDSQEEPSDVSVATSELATPELMDEEERRRLALIERAEADEDDDFEDEDDDLDDDEDDDLDDDEDEDDWDEEDDEEFDDDFDDDDWEEVDDDEEDEDEDEEDDLDDDEEDDWDDDEDDDDDWDEEEEDEEEAE